MTTIIKIDDKLQARVTATRENENVVITVGPAAAPLERDNAPGWITVSYFTGGTGWSQIYGRTWSSIYDKIRDLRRYPSQVSMLHKGLELTMDELQSKVKQERLRDPKPSAPPEEVTEFTLCGDFRYRRQFGAWEEMSEWAHDHGADRIEGVTYGGEPIALEEIDRRANRQEPDPDTTPRGFGDIHVRLISDTGNVVDRAFPSWTSLIEWMDQHYRSPHTVHIMHDGKRVSFDRVLARAQKERPTPPRGLANRLRAWWSK